MTVEDIPPLPEEEYSTPLRVAQAGDAPDWRARLMITEDRRGNKKLTTNTTNAVLMLVHHDNWLGVLGYDEFSDRIAVRAAPPFGRHKALDADWGDDDDTRVVMWLERHGFVKPAVKMVRAAIVVAARESTFDPVTSYLRALTWDGIERLPFWLADAFGCDQTEYSAEVGMRWLMSAARRPLEPGCQADYALILEGPQGARKSTAVSALCPERRWFTDELPPMGSKDAAIQLQGTWILELAELDTLARSDVSAVKAFVTRRVDRYRPPFGVHTSMRPRRTILCGTVNPGDSGYLKDDTGNRRWWPIVVKHDIARADWVAANRDQLWAEAVVRLGRGEPSYIADRHIEAQAVEEQEARRSEDPWLGRLAEWSVGRSGFQATGVILERALEIDPGKQTKYDQMRVGAIMRDLGWRRVRPRLNGVRVWGFESPSLL